MENKKSQFEDGTFIEYYYNFGIDSGTIFSRGLINPEVYTEKSLSHIKPTLISKFPPFQKSISDIDERVIMTHCFPHGFQPVESLQRPHSEAFHFTLDNLAHLSTAPKLYFTTLVFYEPLRAYEQLKKIGEKRNRSRSSSIMSGVSMINTKPQKKSRRNSAAAYSSRLSLPATTPARRKTFTKIIKKNSLIRQIHFGKARINNEKLIYFPKAITLSSLYPFPNEKKTILTYLYNYVLSNKITFPIEKIIENFVLETPFPTKGIYEIVLTLGYDEIKIFQQPINSLQFSSYKMHLIFGFKVYEILEIFCDILLEKPILFFCSQKEKLTNLVETFLSLISPFEYQYKSVSILPETNYGLIEIEKRFVFGINEAYSEEFFTNNNLNVNNNKIIIVDYDKKQIKTYLNADSNLPMINIKDLSPSSLPTQNVDSNPPSDNIDLPSKYKGKLFTRLTHTYSSDKKKIDSLDSYDNEITQKIASIFSYILISIFNDYLDFMFNEEKDMREICTKIKTNSISSIKELFKVDDFLNNKNKSDQLFYSSFFETKMFFAFMCKRYYHDDLVEKLSILLFDEGIAEKKNKKFFFGPRIETNFINDQRFKKKIKVPVPPVKSFSQSERRFIINMRYSNNPPLKYFQKITEFDIKYYVYPKLLYDNYFFDKPYNGEGLRSISINIHKNYITNLLQIVSNEKYFKIYDGSLVYQEQLRSHSFTFHKEIENFIFILWLRLFAMTFYYCDRTEKIYRFYEMLDILKKSNFVDHKTLSFIFTSLCKYGTEYMVIKFYELISLLKFTQKYTEFAYLCEKLSSEIVYKSYTKKFSLVSSKMSIAYFKEKEEEHKIYQPSKEEINAMRKRTFGLDDPEKEDVVFDTEVKCNYCGKTIEVVALLIKYENMDKINEMGPCIYCRKFIVPTIQVRIGEDSLKESFNLCSPYMLYKYSNSMIEKYSTELPLEEYRKDYSRAFWNSIWYFTLKMLPFDMFLSYGSHYKEESIDPSLEKEEFDVQRVESFEIN